MGFQKKRWMDCGSGNGSLLLAKVVSKDKKTEMVSDTIEFRHHKLTLPTVTPGDKVLNGVQRVTPALKNTPASTVDA